MKYMIFTILFLLSPTSMAALNIFSCEPEWAALSKELGGDNVDVFSATSGLQDPHYIQARPSLIAKARQADILFCTGAELEAGWLPLLQRKTGNPAIQTGGEGYFMATDYVRLLDKPVTTDRSQGHVHAAGNPHIQTSPVNILIVAEKFSQFLQTVDSEHAADYQQRWLDFQHRWKQAMTKWTEQAKPLKGVNIVVQHDAYPYLREWLGLNQVVTLEPKPGVPPSVSDLNRVVNVLHTTPAKMILVSAYQSSRATDWLVNKVDINRVVLPFTVGGNENSNDLFSLFDDSIKQLLNGLS